MSILQNIEKQQKHDKHIISPNAIHKEQWFREACQPRKQDKESRPVNNRTAEDTDECQPSGNQKQEN
jgi:hypothetical protein